MLILSLAAKHKSWEHEREYRIICHRDDFPAIPSKIYIGSIVKRSIEKNLSKWGEALFYVRKTLENGWSRAMLLNFLDVNLYSSQGKAITNFDRQLPALQSDLAKEVIKDPYIFFTLRRYGITHMVRNVTAHELKVKWVVNWQDAIDILTTFSIIMIYKMMWCT